MKKKYFYFVILGIMLLVLEGCPMPMSNTAPTAPSNPVPQNGASGVPVKPTLGWQASMDLNGDPVTYDLYFGEAQDNLSVKASDLTTNSYTFTKSLNYGTTYYWKVVAKDGKGGQISSPIWSFTTKVGSTNTPPSAPSNPVPANGKTEVSITPTLGWDKSTDPDGDDVIYDLYLGTNEENLEEDPVVKASDLDTNSYTITESLDYETTYYWKVVAKDGQGGETSGPVWNLTTKANEPPTAPTNPSPANGKTEVSITPTLGWDESTDPDGDDVIYDLYLGTNEENLEEDPVVKANDLDTNSYEFTESLDYETTYYWKVVAKDENGGKTSSEVWSFTTMEFVISDLNDLTASDSLYILRIFIDEDIQGLMSAIDEYTGKNYIDLEESEDVFDRIDAIKEYYQGLWEIYGNYPDAIDKLKDMMDSSENLVGNGDLRVQIFGQAKADIIDALEGTQEPETLVVDYRDLLNMRMQVWGLLSLYEAKDPLQPYFDAVDSIEQDSPLVYFLRDDSYPAISAFINKYPAISAFINKYIDEISNEPWETEDFWEDLNSLVTTLAGKTGESNVLTTNDIFKGDVLSIGGLDFAIEKGKFILESFNDLYYFEEEKTDEDGWTDDDAISLYEYPYFVYVVGDINININIKQTKFMDEPIILEDLISELLPEELSALIDLIDLIDIVEELKFGDIDLLQEPSWIELFEELNSVLPNGVLELTANIQTPVIIEGSVDGTVSIDVSINLDFGALSDGTPLDLMSNNLGMNKAMIGKLIEQAIWNILASDNMTQDQASTIYNIILYNLTFYDPDTNILTIEIDDSIIAEVVINLGWE